MTDHIHTVNALKVRNQFGEVLEMLERDGCPILVSKGREIRAVLITPEDFHARFVDRLADDARQRMLEAIRESREPLLSGDQVDEALRSLRGELR